MSSRTSTRTHIDSGIVADSMRGLLTETRLSLAFLPALRKPAIAWYWLRTARRAQLALAMAVVTVLLLLPPVLELGLGQLFPDRTLAQETLSGLPHATQPDARAASRATLLLGIAWGISAGVVGLLFALHIPVAVARCASVSRALEQCADAERAQSRVRALLLYREALELASDPPHAGAIREKMRVLEAPPVPARTTVTVSRANMAPFPSPSGSFGPESNRFAPDRYW